MIRLTSALSISGLIAIGFGTACFGGDVQSVPTRGVDFSKFKTYQWLPTKVLGKQGIIEDDPDLTPLIKKALNEQLAKKGFTEVAQGGDIEVATLILMQPVPQLEALIYGPSPDTDWGSTPFISLGRYNRHGTLGVNLIDPKAKKSIWLGLASRALGKPSNRGNDIAKAASDLFKKYPGTK